MPTDLLQWKYWIISNNDYYLRRYGSPEGQINICETGRDQLFLYHLDYEKKERMNERKKERKIKP